MCWMITVYHTMHHIIDDNLRVFVDCNGLTKVEYSRCNSDIDISLALADSIN